MTALSGGLFLLLAQSGADSAGVDSAGNWEAFVLPPFPSLATFDPATRERVSSYVLADATPGRYQRRPIIFQIQNPSDDETQQRGPGFALSEPLHVEVLAIGEMKNGLPADYGWISRPDGSVVWDLRGEPLQPVGFRKSFVAARDTLTLEPGSYSLHFVTDSTTCSVAWAEESPPQSQAYGITVYNLRSLPALLRILDAGP